MRAVGLARETVSALADSPYLRPLLIPTGAALIVFVILSHGRVQASRRKRTLQEAARRKKAERDAKLHKALQAPCVDSEFESELTRLPAYKIIEAIRAKKVTSERVTQTFCQRAHHLGLKRLNAVTEELYDVAVSTARAVDQGQGNGAAAAAAAGSAATPRVLEGLPVSIKDSINMAGCDTTFGMAVRCFKPIKEDSLVISLLRDAGAVLFVRTNVPQSLLVPETDNAVWGRTDNPWKPDRTPGGSSGGEAALVAVRASPLGIGSDIGGSLRIPAHFSGVFGFKPTPERVSRQGSSVPRRNNRNGQVLIPSVVGPLANCTEDLALVLKAWFVPNMWAQDPYVVPKPFDTQAYTKGRGRPLRVGAVLTDHWFQPCTAATRAVREAQAALTQAGHEVVACDLPVDGWEVTRLYYRIMGADGSLHLLSQGLEGEALLPHYQTLKTLASLPDAVRPFINTCLRLAGEQRLLHLSRGVRSAGLSFRDYYEVTADLLAFQEAFVRFMKDQRLDALLLPVVAVPAFLHTSSKDLTPTLSYCFLLNLLRWPAGVVPVTRVREDEAHYDTQQLPPNQRDTLAARAARQMRGAAGLPVGVQLATVHNEDELCLHLMAQLEAHLPQDSSHLLRPAMAHLTVSQAATSATQDDGR